jgi:hypothetical protein
MSRWSGLLAVTSSLALGACASAGGGSTASSTPPPLPPQTLKQALNSNQNFANDAGSIALSLDTSTGAVQSGTNQSPALTVRYDASTGDYILTMGADSESFGPSDLQANSVSGRPYYSKSNTDNLVLISSSPSSGITYTYGGLGAWQQNTVNAGIQNITFTTFTYGLQTSAAAVPRTGTASFSIDVIGAVAPSGQAPIAIGGPGEFNVDFQTGVFSAHAFTDTINVVTGAGTTGGIVFAAAGHLSGVDSTFSGESSFEDGSINMGGPLAGRFYGPKGQEVGASFSGSQSDGGTMAGSFYGSESTTSPTANLALTNIIADQSFPALSEVLEIYPGAPGTTNVLSTSGQSDVNLNKDGSFTFLPPFSNQTNATFTAADKIPSALPNFTTYQTTVVGSMFSNNEPTQIQQYNAGPTNTELALTYTTFGIWQQDNLGGSQNEQDRVFYTYGVKTLQSIAQHLTGEGHYSGVVYGGAIDRSNGQQFNVTGSTSFDVNFSSQTFTSAFNLNGAGLNGAANRNFGDFNATGTIAYDQNVGTVTQAGVDVGGISVQFNGPTAEELGAAFHASQGGLGATTFISGVMAAKKN